MTGYDDQQIYDTKQGVSLNKEMIEDGKGDPGYDDYDDGFDELSEDLLSDDSLEETGTGKRKKFKMLSGLSNVSATIIGAVLILGLVYLLVSMIRLVADDLGQVFNNL